MRQVLAFAGQLAVCMPSLRGFGCISAAALLAATTTPATAQTCGSIGTRIVKAYWIEANFALVVTPEQPFDNSTVCTKSDKLFVMASNPAYKPMLAAVMHAMATRTPIQGWACGCQTFWNNDSWPVAYALGVGTP